MELFISLDGVGLSLVNSKPDEVAYIKLRRYVSRVTGFKAHVLYIMDTSQVAHHADAYLQFL